MRCLDDSEEQRGQDEKAEKPKIFSSFRGTRAEEAELILIGLLQSLSLGLGVCMGVEHSTQLNSLHALTKILLVYDFIKQIPITSLL